MNAPPSALARHTLRGTVLVFVAESLLLPTGLVTVAFLTRRLGPEGYGLYTLTAAVVAWVQWVIASLFSRVGIKFVGEAEDWRPVGGTLLRLHAITSGVGAGLLWLLAGPFAALLGEPALAGYLRLFAIDVPLFGLAQAHRTILVGVGGFTGRAVAAGGRWTIRMVLILLLVASGLSVPGAILGSLGGSLIELLIIRAYIRPSFSGRSPIPIQRWWTFALPLFLFALSLRLYDRLDLFALKILGGSVAQVGVYGAAQNLSLMPGIFALSFSPLLLSSLSRAFRTGDREEARALGREALRAVVLLLPLAGMTAGASPEIAAWILGPSFLPAAPLLALLIFAAVALSMISVTTAILTAADRPGWTFAVAGPLLPLAVVGHLLAIPRWGGTGAALVTTVVAVVGAAVSVAAVHRVWRILPPLGTMIRSLALTPLAYTLAAVRPAPGAWLLVSLPAIGLVILLGFVIMREFRPRLTVAGWLAGWRATEQD